MELWGDVITMHVFLVFSLVCEKCAIFKPKNSHVLIFCSKNKKNASCRYSLKLLAETCV